LKIFSIKKSSEFKGNTSKLHSKTILLVFGKTPVEYLRGDDAFCRVGYVVSKKSIGNAVKRNRVKRRFREAFRAIVNTHCKPHYDYILIAKTNALNSSYKNIAADMTSLIKIARLPIL
jgi:ribonuclease P protein component